MKEVTIGRPDRYSGKKTIKTVKKKVRRPEKAYYNPRERHLKPDTGNGISPHINKRRVIRSRDNSETVVETIKRRRPISGGEKKVYRRNKGKVTKKGAQSVRTYSDADNGKKKQVMSRRPVKSVQTPNAAVRATNTDALISARSFNRTRVR
jgi:hypothetical protein